MNYGAILQLTCTSWYTTKEPWLGIKYKWSTNGVITRLNSFNLFIKSDIWLWQIAGDAVLKISYQWPSTDFLLLIIYD